MNVDQWIREQSFGMIPIYEPLKRRRVGDERSNKIHFSFGRLSDKESIDDWNIISTIGDGSCLIHAFLILLSPTYHTFSREDKIILGREFRLLLSDRIHFTDDQRRIMKNVPEYLDDEIGNKIAEYLGYNVMFLQFIKSESGTPIPQIITFSTRNAPVLIIANQGGVAGRIGSGGHFEAVERIIPGIGSQFTSDPRLLSDIEHVINRLLGVPILIKPGRKPGRKPSKSTKKPGRKPSKSTKKPGRKPSKSVKKPSKSVKPSRKPSRKPTKKPSRNTSKSTKRK